MVIHLRDTMSMIATAHRFARVKWVKSYPHTRFGFHSSQSGHGLRGIGSRGGLPCNTRPSSNSKLRTVDSDTHTRSR